MIAPNTLHMFAARVIADTDSDDTTTVVRAVIDATLTRYAVVELPEPDCHDDGQTYFADYAIRVDHTGSRGPTCYLNGHEIRPDHLKGIAADYLAAARILENGTSR